MQTILDVLWIKTYEKNNNIKITKEQLTEALLNGGEVEIKIKNKPTHLSIPTLNFPYDLINETYIEQDKIWPF